MTPSASISSYNLPEISGYAIAEKLYLGSHTAVYRAIQTETQRPVVLKVLRRDYPNFRELMQFRNQYAIAKNLPIAGIVQPLSLETVGNGYALVMEDWGGISLKKYQQQQPLDLAEVLEISRQLADILHELHQHRVVHKDIKPDNILIHPDSKEIKLIDFSIASLLPKETQHLQSPNVLEGTLAYLAPEQTGRMNRGIDYRADFYALGVTLYQLLGRQLPFSSDDPLELLHCHMAKAPTPLDRVNPDVPERVSAIVSKLMAKNAEDRYQSAKGLKYDLQKCDRQWRETGKIEWFQLGQRDLSDRFLIPEKLYGREAEVQALLESFDRIAQGSTELMLVAGFSGIGKTAVVNEVHKPITRQNGYFIKGKFDQFNRNIPLSAFVQAFRDLIGYLLSESDEQLQEWKARILNAVGENGQVLIAAIPELKHIVGQQPPVPELSGSAAQNRFNLLFQKFIQVFTSPEHPLTIFLDDLQWADSASLELLKLLMSDNRHLLMLGAYRDNEVSPVHRLMLTLEELGKTEAIVRTITLEPLAMNDTNLLIADTLRCSPELALPLTELIDRKTNGNPFFTTQFLKALHEDGYITFNRDRRYWQCDIAQINALALTDDVVEFMALQLQKLPEETQHVLKLAACVGNQFDLSTLSIVSEQSPIDTAITFWRALQEGFILPINQTYKFFQTDEIEPLENENNINPTYRFLHDRVQQAAYSLIPENQKQTAHYQIGQLLLEKTDPESRGDRIFAIVNQLNYGTDLITEPKEREELARLNLMACRKARAATAYQAAFDYTRVGLLMLGERAWQQHYDMTLSFGELAAEVAMLCGHWEEMEESIDRVVREAHSLPEKVNVYRIRIQSNVSRNKFAEAITIAQPLLEQLGVALNSAPTATDIQQEIAEIEELIGERNIEDLVEMPAMTDIKQLAIVQIASSVMAAAYICASPLLPLLVSLAVKVSIRYGNTSASVLSYVFYSVILCNVFKNVDAATEFGSLALKVVSKLDAKPTKPEMLSMLGGFIVHRKSHVRETLPLLQDGYATGLEVGSLEYAGYNANIFCLNSLSCGKILTSLESEIRAYSQSLTQLNQLTTGNYCRIYWQTALNLLGLNPHPMQLAGEAIQESEILPIFQSSNDLYGLYVFYLHKLILCVFLADVEQAKSLAVEARNYLIAGAGTFAESLFYLYDSLTALVDLPQEPEARSDLLERVEENQAQLQHWAHYAPMNHQHKFELVEAEKFRVLGKPYEAGDWYDRAITGAKEYGFLQEEALANELAAKFYLEWGKRKLAIAYMEEAYYAYARWEAKAKAEDLERRYPQLLEAILQPKNTISNSESTSNLFSLMESRTSTNTSQLWLDFPAVMQAAQTISQEIKLDKLLAKLMQIAITNVGATRAALILEQELQWQLVADTNSESTNLLNRPLVEVEFLPHSVIYSTIRQGKAVVFDRLSTSAEFARDSYLTTHRPGSILCIPISKQGRILGIFYMENNLTVGAFTRDRIEVLQILAGQAAISLENAQLYAEVANYSQSLEQEVQRKTEQLSQKAADLEQALEDLQHTQSQLIQSEKMSAIGQLVGGIAHEINNPVSFIQGNLHYTESYVKKLLDLLLLYQQEYPEQNATIQAKVEESDLEFILEDVTQILESMKVGSERIKQIVLSLRNFSRLDEADLKSVDLHLGIESSLLILQSRFHESQPEVQAVTTYGQLPEVTCYASEINQVFFSLISNALDAFKEVEEMPKNPQIRIQTEVLDNGWVRIAIADNGCGISEDTQKRMFDPFFTTKPVGSGTGLGLSVSYAIVKKHGGELTCASTVGSGSTFAIEIPIEPRSLN
ncbi:trifunctional serine/threonine-protein kinase/ATP-binding protein/sensor histidine kinase [Roseofilum casamattae]|uniref:histidine kinase n=1 Tax=Roseofilum casamattae BLCC-M143 TaxID=3022442 RepID=A0ABT7BTH6_9CYAN|nr:ATP-binding sensor histidine kinase [Roseofilum casamattae]MDJ1182487.1 AAA family ATPase [Roseofilum casamattae BLCC-M143]